MMKLVSFILGLLLGLTCSPPLAAQTAASAHADKTAVAAGPASTTQAPDDVIRKLSDLIHGSKYTEAQRLTTGLLLAYPDDQRLIKAKALLNKLPERAASAIVPATTTQAPAKLPPAQPAATAPADEVAGMDRVEYNSLLELARQAQQNTALKQQKVLLKQFMDASKPFLQKYPSAKLLWELRAASALSVYDPAAGYEAGQQLLANGAADSNDPAVQQLLAKLKIKGWFDRQQVEDYNKRYGWLSGTWTSSVSVDDSSLPHVGLRIEFARSASGDIEAEFLDDTPHGYSAGFLRGVIGSTGQITWEMYLHAPEKCPSEWQPVMASEVDVNKGTIRVVVPSRFVTRSNSSACEQSRLVTWIFTKE